MPFVPVPKDLAKVKTKVAFNLTKRQIVCFGAGGLVGVPAYIFTRGSIGNEPAALLMIGLMLPFFLFGIYEKDGQPLEAVLRHKRSIRVLIAEIVSIAVSCPLFYQAYKIWLAKVGYPCYYLGYG